MQSRRAAVWITMFAIAGMHSLQAGPGVWTSMGPYGGSVGAVVIDPSNPDIAYTGSSGGVFRTVNGGANWNLANSGLPPHYIAYSLAIDPQNPTTVYAGGNCEILRPCGIYKSTDGGANWNSASVGLGPVASVDSLVIDPQNPATLYAGINVGTDGCSPTVCYTPAVFKSMDGGATWTVLISGSGGGWIPEVPLAIDPQNPGTLYAALSCAYTSCSGGVFKSTDGGSNWRLVNSGLPSCCITALVIDRRSPNTIYAVGGGVFKTTNGGVTWSAAGAGLAPSCCYLLAIDPRDSTLYAGGYDQLSTGLYFMPFRSSDGGRTWASMPRWSNPVPPLNPNLVNTFASLTIDLDGTLYLGTPGLGLFKSTDRAQNWTAVNSGLSATEVYSAALDPENPGTIYAGIGSGLFKTTDGGANWSAVGPSQLARSAIDLNRPARGIVVDPHNTNTIYALGQGRTSSEIFKSPDGGASWISLNEALAAAGSGPVYPDGPLAFDPHHPGTLFVGGQLVGAPPSEWGPGPWGLFQSTDGGSTWTHISFGNDPTALAFDPHNPGTVYMGTGGCQVLKSTDGGARWTKLPLPPGFVPDGSEDFYCWPIAVLVVDPQKPGTLYAGGISGLWKSTDDGATWNTVSTTGLPGSWPGVTALVIDPRNSDTVYAASGNRAFRSTDGAAHWTNVTSGLTARSINNLMIHPKDPDTVYAGTVGGGLAVITFAPGNAR